MKESVLVPDHGNRFLDIDRVISATDNIVRHQYLNTLSDAEVMPASAEITSMAVGSNVRLFAVDSLSLTNHDNLSEKIKEIYGALVDFHATPVFVLDSDGYRSRIYFGVACDSDADSLSTCYNTFRGMFTGCFPGAVLNRLNLDKTQKLLNQVFDSNGITVSSLSSIPALHIDTAQDGMEKLIDGMRGKPFTMVLISQAVPKANISAARQTLEAMYSQIAPFQKQTISLNVSEARSKTNSFSLTRSTSATKGTSVTENVSFSNGKSSSRSEQVGQQKEREKNAANQLVGTALSLLAMMTDLGADMIPLQGLFYGSAISNTIGAVEVLLNGQQQTYTETNSTNENYSLGYSDTETSSVQEGYSSSKGISDGSTRSKGNTVQVSYENRSVTELLSVISQQIERLQLIENSGGFNTAVYFVSGDNATALTVANMYKALLNANIKHPGISAVNSWNNPGTLHHICEYLKHIAHPVFRIKKENYPLVTPCTLIGTDELSAFPAIPEKALPGIIVSHHAEFARDVLEYGSYDADRIPIGHIFHMGKVEKAGVALNKERLSGHMFVTGTTGTGKSNYCYLLLHELRKAGVKFLVVEPAKGEYSQVFGGLEDVYTFGTNPDLGSLLKINPFSFPKGIHVNEHINRLVEIFNACWPMYAAMPQVLKDGIETVYRKHGYNLLTGRSDKGTFPSLTELLDVLPAIIRKSEFSSEVQGNYIGSLVTRLKSLTTGLYGCIFSGESIDDKILFDENVLIDLSRVGSSETKSLLMGMLVMKLQEYRMCTSEMNRRLTHVTLLEEAHHLLKASPGGSEEANLRRMSLEMITNSIAEMRTYGEGFIIADQSPTLMDLAVIRNTNTKLIFKLPEFADRNCAGQSVSLTADQINELSKLETGVAVVYQSNWGNPVLTKISYFDTGSYVPLQHQKSDFAIYEDRNVNTQLIAMLVQNRLSAEGTSSFDTALCQEIIANKNWLSAKSQQRTAVMESLLEAKQDIEFPRLCKLLNEVVNAKELVHYCQNSEDLGRWYGRACEFLGQLAKLSPAECMEVVLLCINIISSSDREARKLYFRLYSYFQTLKMQF